jgi:hypothetical protein
VGFPGEFLLNGRCGVTKNVPRSTAGGVCGGTLYIYYLLLSPFPWEARLSLINRFYFRSFRIYANSIKIGSNLKCIMSKFFSATNRSVCVGV